MANKEKVPITGIGTIQLNINGFTLRIHKVYYIPSLAFCLYSVKEHMKYNKCFTHFGNNHATLSFPKFKFTIFNEDDLYIYVRSIGQSTNKIHWDSNDHSQHHTNNCLQTSKPQHMPSYKPNPSKAANRRITNIDLHRYFGFRTLKNIKYFITVSKPTVQIIDAGDIPLEIGALSHIQRTTRNTLPLQRPNAFFDVAHMDIAYGDVTAPGAIKYSLIIVDRKTRFTYTLPLKNCKGESIIFALKKLKK